MAWLYWVYNELHLLVVNNLYLLEATSIVFFPLFGFFWSLVLIKPRYQRKLNRANKILIIGSNRHYYHLSFTGIPFFLNLHLLYVFLKANFSEYSKTYISYLFDWLYLSSVSDFFIKVGLRFDALSLTMIFVITFVSFFVQLYSLDYMHDDPNLDRFLAYLSLFTFFMLFLVTANNMIQLFVGWEGVGLVSFLLVNFWYTRDQAVKSAIKAITVNKVGDSFLVIALVLLFLNFKTLDITLINNLILLKNYYFNNDLLFTYYPISEIISFFLFFAAVAKSAQLGLHTWLPDAMEGPTPVSALIHAATMVTAGVFLLLRFSFILEFSPNVRTIVVVFGSLTAVFGATTALFQNDIKRIIAYSTCSQLGYMVLSIGLSNYNLSLFHLFNHAYFKALLFLSAGVVIHALSGEQDIRKMGGLINILPFTYFCIFVSSLSLIGFPFLTGFYSKDLILTTSLSYGNFLGFFSYFLSLLAALFTAAYSTKLLVLVFLTSPNGFRDTYKSVHEGPFYMSIAQFFLILGTIFFGFIFNDAMVGLASSFWGSSIYQLYYNTINIYYSEMFPTFIKLLPIYLSVFIIFLCLISYLNFYLKTLNFSIIKNCSLYYYNFFSKKWFFDLFYNRILIYPLLNFSYSVSYVLVDRGILEWLGPYGVVRLIAVISNYLTTNIHTGSLHFYIQVIISGMFFIILYVIDFFLILSSIIFILSSLYYDYPLTITDLY